jgi:pimeloyl-ACP methyl ester carboxylesterase
VRKVTVKGSGHWVHSEQPEAFISVMRAFLGD